MVAHIANGPIENLKVAVSGACPESQEGSDRQGTRAAGNYHET